MSINCDLKGRGRHFCEKWYYCLSINYDLRGWRRRCWGWWYYYLSINYNFRWRGRYYRGKLYYYMSINCHNFIVIYWLSETTLIHVHDLKISINKRRIHLSTIFLVWTICTDGLIIELWQLNSLVKTWLNPWVFHHEKTLLLQRQIHPLSLPSLSLNTSVTGI